LFSQNKTPTTQLYRDYENLADKIEMLNLESRRGVILYLREAALFRQKIRASGSRVFGSPRTKSGNFLNSVERNFLFSISLVDKIANNFIDDVAVISELVAFFESISSAHRSSSRTFILRLNAFFLHEKPVAGLEIDPSDPFEVLFSFVNSDVSINKIDELIFSEPWIKNFQSDLEADDELDETIAEPQIAHVDNPLNKLDHANKSLGEMIDVVVESAMKSFGIM
jgi:hypothetical protein